MSTWTDPKTWQTGEALTASDMNTHIKDNLNALKLPPTAHHELNQTADLTTTSTSFVDVDAGADVGDEFTLSITTTGGDVLLGFTGHVKNSTATAGVYFDVHESVSGSRLAGDDGMTFTWDMTTANIVPVSFVYLLTGLSAGTHVFKLQWKVSSGTATMWVGAGTANADMHPQFWVREVS